MTAVILVVEDQPAMQRNIQVGLEMAGYKVVVAADGSEALDALNSRPIDLILADIAMPRMNGYQLYEKLRQDPRWVRIPFVFISARGLDSDVRFGKALGADDYLVKPFQLEDLLAIVAGRLRRARELAQSSSTPADQVPAAAPAAAGREYLTADSLRISVAQHRVWKNCERVELSLKEFTLLEYLARRPGLLVSFTELCRVTHGLELSAVEAGNLLYPLIRSLRRRLGYAAGEMGCIESVRGVGYRLAAPAQEADPQP
jgi:two-component system alkaline phosphatase synthesis response regulator PhoP